jgi:hypothetical protein
MQGNTQMVETEPFDIYLCDNCDAELYSLEAYKVSAGYAQAKLQYHKIFFFIVFLGT